MKKAVLITVGILVVLDVLVMAAIILPRSALWHRYSGHATPSDAPPVQLGYPNMRPLPPRPFEHITYPEVGGSTSTELLGMYLKYHYLGLEPCRVLKRGWSRDSSVTIFPAAPAVGQPGPSQVVQSEASPDGSFEGTGKAYQQIIGKQRELILVAREPSPDELKAAKTAGVELLTRPIALDAFVFLCSSQNSVPGLTLSQIRDIYTGKLDNWRQVGGEDHALHAYQRERNSGSQELLEKLVMNGQRPKKVPDEMRPGGMGMLVDQVATDPDSLGYSVYYYEEVMYRRTDVKLLGINGVLPSGETIRNRSYPLTAPVYAVIRKDLDPNGLAYQLWDWLITREGQAVIAASGYVPLAGEAPPAKQDFRYHAFPAVGTGMSGYPPGPPPK
ncbi:MAG TPA: substrate-binding domain-containing protein [Armatimonadota bacterium]|jgi:phosphate transport system substrate-binding protein